MTPPLPGPLPSYRDRLAVRGLARLYRMPESYVRHMLAVESGESDGDVIVVRDAIPQRRLAQRVVRWLLRVASV